MAKPLKNDGAIALLEDAIHLLRRAPLATLLCHLTGSAPLALGLLIFWNDVTNTRTLNGTIAIESVALAVLLAWMNCWRTVFAGRLRRQLSGTADAPWSWRRVWNLVAGQSFLGATRLIAVPAAGLIIFPFAWVVNFYRTTTALGDRDDLDVVQLIAEARRLSGLQQRQSWAVLPLLLFLGLVLTVNLALLLALLPQLVRIFTGYESVLSQAGVYFIFNPLFLLSVLSVSWMLFDPFTQAVFCVRCFRGESITSGEDLRAGMRALVTSAGLFLLLLIPFHFASAAVSPQDLETSVRKAVLAHEYDWRLPPPGAATDQTVSWFVKITDRIVDGLRAAKDYIGDLIHRLFEWLRGMFKGAPSGPPGIMPTGGLHQGVYILIAAVVVFAVWLAWRRKWFVRARPKIAAVAVLPAIDLTSEDLTADRLPEQSWLDLAANSLNEGNFRLALRAFYLANLAWLGRRELLTIHPGKTNHEYEVELRRKARSLGEARRLFSVNVAAFERAWYGLHEVTAEDAVEFRRRMDAMKQGVAV
jgi:Domain of unknown function (DUF4129)